MPASQPFPLPPMCELPDKDLVYPEEHITLLYLDSSRLSGGLVSYQPEQRLVTIKPKNAQAPIVAKLDELKMMVLPRARPYILSKSVKESEIQLHSKPQGVEVVFSDGGKLSGETLGFRFDQNGIFIFPTQLNGCFSISFINRTVIDNYNVGSRIGEILIQEKLLSEEGLNASLQEQEAARKKTIGEYLRNNAVVTAADLKKALERQKTFPHMKLGEILISEGLVTEEQLMSALKDQEQNRNTPLGEILVKKGIVSQEDIQSSLAKKMGVPYVDIKNFELDKEVMQWIPEDVAREHCLMPLYRFGSNLAVAIDNPLNWKAISSLRFLTKLAIEPVMAASGEIGHAINRLYGGAGLKQMDMGEFVDGHGDQLEDQEQLLEESISDNVNVKLVNKIIHDAHHQGASDIHIEPFPGKESVRVRIRKDGALVNFVELPAQSRSAIIGRIKIMARLDIGERRRPQDGKIDFGRYSKLKIELRVATLPTAGGMEDVVLRILDSGFTPALNEIGFSEQQLQLVNQLIWQPYGLFLVCGPTGSGKTTTLHSILRVLYNEESKIWTVEDPVEITQPGLRQLQVHSRIGLNFANAMRAFLRADPDIIMVGEMRDSETVRTVIESSLTGHMVFSTMHTNSAPESIVRLLDMGMDPFNFADALSGVLAQRLVRALCKECKEAYHPDQKEVEALIAALCHYLKFDNATEQDDYAKILWERWQKQYQAEDGTLTLYRTVGCDLCNSSGYAGRMGLYELMQATAGIKVIIIKRKPVVEIKQMAMREGMRTLRQDGIEKVLAGRTDMAQIRRVSIN